MKHHLFIGIVIIAFVLGVVFLRFAGDVFVREIIYGVSSDFEIAPVREESAMVGHAAPAFELFDLDGTPAKSPDFLGKPAFLVFWTTWNPAAADQVAVLDAYRSGGGDALFSVVAVNSQEDRSVVLQFIRRGGYRLRVLLDETGAVGDGYGARSLPTTYLLDTNGIVRDVRVGIVGKAELESMFEKIVE